MNAANPAWRAIDPMAFARRRMNLTLLADGTVMAHRRDGLGRQRSRRGPRRRDLGPGHREVDDASSRWPRPGCTTRPRSCSPTAASSSAAARPAAASAPRSTRRRTCSRAPGRRSRARRRPAAYGSTIQVTSPDAASITSVALLRPSAATHAFDMNQRYVPLTLHALREHAQRDRAGLGRRGAARRLHAHHQERRRRPVGGEVRSGSARPADSSPAPSPAG